MRGVQLPLFARPNPLLRRFGRDFFRQVPAVPGVYQMRGQSERLLYVGQSKNLRQRLGSYRSANAETISRKARRLLHAVISIDWQVESSSQAARLKENELLRTYRPRFNTVNTYPRAYCFAGLRQQEGGIGFFWGPELRPDYLQFGAFKRGAAEGYGALLRLLWAAALRPEDIYQFPSPLLRPRPPALYSLEFSPRSLIPPADCWQMLSSFFSGASDELVAALGAGLLPGTAGTFQGRLYQADLGRLADFYLLGPRRNRRLERYHGLPTCLILQEQLDDLLVGLKDK